MEFILYDEERQKEKEKIFLLDKIFYWMKREKQKMN